jgi:hypothetical protein
MKKLFLLIAFCALSVYSVKANDGVFYVNGNEIMPIKSTNIRVDKEILNIKKISDKQVSVSVYYEFFNPGSPQTLQVGFEATPPQGEQEMAMDSQVKPGNTDKPHPNIHQFTVQMNESILPFTNHVEYNKQYGFPEKYVYLFGANFRSGKNVVRHSYICDLSMSVSSFYEFSYVLDAAKRWAGGTIGDFTLNIDMGEQQAFGVRETFFKDLNDWTLTGTGKVIDYKRNKENMNDSIMKCYLRQGCMVYHKLNFNPNHNLIIFCLDGICIWGPGKDAVFDAKAYKDDLYSHIPFTDFKDNPKGKDEFSERVIRNLPYARHGYVFQNKDLNDFFKTIEWYLPDPNFKP